MGVKKPDGYESIACPTVTEMTHVLSKFAYRCRGIPAFIMVHSGIWWQCSYQSPVDFMNPPCKGATATIACADMMIYLLEEKLISPTKIRKLLGTIVSDEYKKEKPEAYELDCPGCRTEFEVGINKVGPVPFLTECPDCGMEVSSDFICRTIYKK